MPLTNKYIEKDINVGMDQRDEWMKWDDGPLAQDLAMLDQVYSSDRMSSNEPQWPTNVNSKVDFEQMTIEDAPYDVEDTLTLPELDLEVDLELPSPETPLRANQTSPYYGYSSLALDKERELQQIAMPNRKESFVSTTTNYNVDSSFSPEEEVEALSSTSLCNKKRKTSSKSSPSSADTSNLCQSRKRGHSAIEKRYRTSLNAKIVLLRQSVPSLRVLTKGEVAMDNDEAKNSEKKYSKAVILTRSVEYISHLKDYTKRLSCETVALTARVAAFEKLAMSWSI